MPGIRVYTDDVTWFNSRVAITHPTKKMKPKYEPDGKRTGCAACGGIVHERKTVHLDFDAYGNAFVSADVLKLLQEAGLDRFGLMVANDADNPPPQYVHMAGPPVALTAFNERYEGRFPRLHVIKNRLLRPSEQAVPKE